MTSLDPSCCADYERVGLSRRRFLAGLAATGTTAVATSMFGQAVRQASYGATRGGNVLLVLSMRGGVDGLGLVVPHGDPAYYSARPRIGVPASQLVAKDAFFGLHPAMAPLSWLWDAGELAAVHAVGMEAPNRSHFEAMEIVEDASPGSSVRQGWVNRMAGLGTALTPYDAVMLGTGVAPTIIDGPTSTLTADSVADIELAGASNGFERARRRQLATMWAGQDGPLGQATRSALATVRTMTPLATASYRPRVAYPESDLAAALKDSAQLVKADIGTEVITVDFGGWDLHDGYGTLDWGAMTAQVAEFAAALDAFLRDLGPLRSRVTVVTISEFGRRLAENGNRGLDHGWGNMMLLAGAGVRGGRYYATWPGLGSGRLVDGDLQVTTDYRNVLGEVVSSRFADKAVSQVFPGLHYAPLGVMRA